MRRLLVLFVVVLLSSALFAANANSAPGPQPGGLDHFLCYPGKAVKGSFPNQPAAVMLKNQFVTTGVFASVGPFGVHCNPVQKTLPDGSVTPITDPLEHLACYPIKTNAVPATAVQSFPVSVQNQFGQGVLVASRAVSLCLPTLKSVQSPPTFVPPANPSLDHFTCYAVTTPPGVAPFPVPSGVKLRDQFGDTGVVIGAPQQLCLPTSKTVDPAAPGTTVTNPEAHLLCFKVTRTKVAFPKTIFDRNQFGDGQVKLRQSTALCLPSFKQKIVTG